MASRPPSGEWTGRVGSRSGGVRAMAVAAVRRDGPQHVLHLGDEPVAGGGEGGGAVGGGGEGERDPPRLRPGRGLGHRLGGQRGGSGGDGGARGGRLEKAPSGEGDDGIPSDAASDAS